MKSAYVGALAIAAALAAASAHATTISDSVGDFLPTFVGPHDADLDITSFTVDLVGSNFIVSATVNGLIGSTPNSEFVFGVNTGGAFAPFSPIETGVLFNSVAVLANKVTAGGSGFVADGLFQSGGPTVTGLSEVIGAGDTLSAVIPVADLPSTGLTPGHYGFSLWTRLDTPKAGQSPISPLADFAPDNSTISAVPEPAGWALMILGFGALGATLRLKRRETAPAAI
jgi:PEP-CTERM motif